MAGCFGWGEETRAGKAWCAEVPAELEQPLSAPGSAQGSQTHTQDLSEIKMNKHYSSNPASPPTALRAPGNHQLTQTLPCEISSMILWEERGVKAQTNVVLLG